MPFHLYWMLKRMLEEMLHTQQNSGTIKKWKCTPHISFLHIISPAYLHVSYTGLPSYWCGVDFIRQLLRWLLVEVPACYPEVSLILPSDPCNWARPPFPDPYLRAIRKISCSHSGDYKIPVSWVAAPDSPVENYLCFRVAYCLHHQGEETSANSYDTTWRNNPEDSRLHAHSFLPTELTIRLNIISAAEKSSRDITIRSTFKYLSFQTVIVAVLWAPLNKGDKEWRNGT
jgi:hypothetical protein